MRTALALLFAATFIQVAVLTADAAPGSVKLGGTIVNVKTGEAVAGVTLLAYSAPQQQQGKPLATATTNTGGHFMLLLPVTQSLVNVVIRVVSPPEDPCAQLRPIGIVGAATAYAARDITPTFAPPSAKATSIYYSTFEPMGWIIADDPCSWRLGSAGLFRGRDLE